MTGTLAQIIALTAHGNHYLRNGVLQAGFYDANTTFQFCNTVDFRIFQKRLFSSKPKEVVAAANPVKWFEYLKAGGCRYLRLYYEHSKDQSLVQDHKIAGFVGGGGTWLIEAVYNGYSNFWANRWQVTNQSAKDSRIWAVNYGQTLIKKPVIDVQIDNDEARGRLLQTLTEIEGFAYSENLQNWGSLFEKSKTVLSSTAPEEGFYHTDLLPAGNYSLTARQLLFSAGTGWVFGGMGSWNDLGFDDPETQKAYDRLSAQLYSDINMAIIAAINTY